ncbi:MAG: substrate-binding domain-containing protein [Lachnospiraceae bacterium]|nr:substrate-binding domain-containing protein [Lachnospiraceae bacterium]
MKKKVLSMFLSVAMAATILVGCGNSNTPASNTPASSSGSEASSDAGSADGSFHFEIVSKGFQHQYWQAVLKGAEQKASELGDTMNFVGPNSESDIAPQVQMLDAAIAANPDAIGLAALDTSACLDAITAAQNAGIPIVGFDSGVPNAPEGAIVANAATDNYAAGALAALETWQLIKDKVAPGTRIGVLSQDATAESIVNRGLGFVDRMADLIVSADLTVNVEGNDRFVNDTIAEKTEGADVIIEVLVPSSVTSELSTIDCQTLLNKADTICIYGSNQHSAEAMVTADENIGKFGSAVVGVGFDSGAVIKAAVADGTFAGAITQAPVAMGEKLVELLHAAASGEAVSDVDTGCQWYTAENMNDAEISQNLYD